MKILWLADNTSPHITRWENALVRKGISPKIISIPKLRPRIKYAFTIKSIESQVKEFQPDIIHAHYASSYGVISTFLKYPCPRLISVWGSDILTAKHQNLFYKLLLKRSLKQPETVLANSKYLLKKSRDLVHRNYLHIPYGIDINKFDACSNKKNLNDFSEIKLGIIKRLHTVAGVDIAIKTVKHLNSMQVNTRFTLFIAGEGPERNKLESLAKDLKIANLITFLGHIPANKICTVYQNIDIAIFPSRIEGLGVSLLEAMASKVPVIANNTQGIKELLNNGEFGVCINNNQSKPIEYAKKILALTKNRKDMINLSSKAYQFVNTTYDINKNVDLLIKEYEILHRNKYNK